MGGINEYHPVSSHDFENNCKQIVNNIKWLVIHGLLDCFTVDWPACADYEGSTCNGSQLHACGEMREHKTTVHNTTIANVCTCHCAIISMCF